MKLRPNLDDFFSLICFKAVIAGMEDILGKEGTSAALIAAGRKRGRDVADSLGITGKNLPTSEIAKSLNEVFGEKGTRLCIISEVTETPDNGYLVKTRETICMAGEPAGSSQSCTFTLGAVIGCLEAITNKLLVGKHVTKITDGSPTDDFLITPK
ncbi:MAG: hypothetical protein SNJ52_05250 [Verrucomicrobiia bacterium]